MQDEIEKVLSMLLSKKTGTTGSGRTDTGVHALQQFFHFDTEEPIDRKKMTYKLNAILPSDIAIENIFSVRSESHARFDAVKRSYIYRISRHKNPFLSRLTYSFYASLDMGLMNNACEKLLGEKDFKCFSKVKTEVNNFICNVMEAKWVEEEGELKFHITANRFLRGMVRAIVGTLFLVGSEKITIEDFENIILSKDRKKAGRAVPPEGLYLSAVIYPDHIYTI